MNITVISKPNCPFCVQAKQLLKNNNLAYEEIELNFGQATTNKLMEVTDFKSANPGVTSLPQIFIDGSRIGGFKELRKYLTQE